MSTAVDPRSVIAHAALPEREVTLCLRGDLVVEVDRLERELRHEQDKNPDALDAGTDARRIAERIEEFRGQMEQSSVTFRLRALPRSRWTNLVRDHPPREGVRTDQAVGVNEDTFYSAVIRACCVDPALSDQEWAGLLDEQITDAQFQELFQAGWELNRRGPSVPFSFGASRILRSSEAG